MNQDSVPSFRQRFGFVQHTSPQEEFPESARKALMYVIENLARRSCIGGTFDEGWTRAYGELLRTARADFQLINENVSPQTFLSILLSVESPDVFTFCERVYQSLLTPVFEYDGYAQERKLIDPVQVAQAYYEIEINNLLSEENLGYRFQDGVFLRPGRIQTQHNTNRAVAVLSNETLSKAREHFTKAQRYFSSRQEPDFQNSVKEAVCALESAITACSGINVSNNFTRDIKELSGTDVGKVPQPLVAAMSSVYAYRGAASGVSHGNADGLRIDRNEAELILSVVAAFITYIWDFFQDVHTDVPF